MGKLVEWSLRFRGTVAALTLLGLLLGARVASKAPLDVFPEFVPPEASIQTEAPGLSPEQVEQLVTRPVEAAVNGAPGLASLRSESIPGLSVVTLIFAEGSDVQAARQGVAERLASLTLPAGIPAPKVSPLVSSTMDLLKIGLVSDTVDPFALRDLADWTLRPRLLAVPGVARLTVFGGSVRQLQILPDFDRMAAYGLTLSDLAGAARGALALRGAGFVDLAAQRVLISTPTPSPDPAVLGATVVAVRSGVAVHLSDVSKVVLGEALKVGDARIQGRPGVLLTISGQYGANTLATTQGVEAALAELTPALTARGIKVYPALHRPANFIERALSDLGGALGLGAVMILAVLLLFLRDPRSALISFLTIPLSLLTAVAVLTHFGQTLNTMTLGGFAVALGVLVDDAIIDVENILRRLRENLQLDEPRPRLAVIRDASLEIRGAVLYATLVVLIAFLPVMLATGVQGRFLRPLAMAFALAVLASLAVAFTITPALCALLLPERQKPSQPRWLAALARTHDRALSLAVHRFGLCALVLGIALVAALAWLPSLGGELLPAFREGHFVLQVSSRIPGTSLAEMLGLGERLSRDLLALPFVATVEQQVGRAELGEDTWGPHRSELHLELKADSQLDETKVLEKLREVLASYPGVRGEVLTFLGDRISESVTGETAQVVVLVFGDRLDDLDLAAGGVAHTLSGIPGVVDLQLKKESGTPMLSVKLDPRALSTYGLRTDDALDAIATAYAGTTVGETFDGARTVEAVILLPAEQRGRLDALSSLWISGPSGRVPLSRVATVALSDGRASIVHEGGRRRVAVTFNVGGQPFNQVVASARRKLAALQLPAGVTLSFAGAAETEAQARRELLLDTGLAIALVMLVLFLAFRRRTYPWLVLAGLPFCLIGSILAVGLSGVGLSLGALVGLVTVFGIGARNSILLLAHFEHLVDQEGAPWNRETLRRGTAERLVPILMTALVTGLGLVPLVIGLHRPGHEIEGPMAVAVLGGLATSTLLNLILMPEMAWRFGGRTPQT
ncbi:MAG TPA: efflux RND transporter permease subunit [Thermoanaerobaculia bacterium]|nr:efflux RND transporter permease subunit [Thermoanaerobaculia bacterium]